VELPGPRLEVSMRCFNSWRIKLSCLFHRRRLRTGGQTLERGPRTYPIVPHLLPRPQQMQYVRIFGDQQGRRTCVSSHRH